MNNNTLTKLAAAGFILFASSWASAATVTPDGVLAYGETERISLTDDSDSPKRDASVFANYDFAFDGGAITFALIDTDPGDDTSSLALQYRASTAVSTWSTVLAPFMLSLKGDASASSYTATSLLSGLYRLTLGMEKGNGGNTKVDVFGITGTGATVPPVSPVPLPGAALLFASGLLGAGALRRRKAKQELLAAASLQAA